MPLFSDIAILWRVGIVILTACALASCSPPEPHTSGQPLDMRRLSEDQYRNIIADVFGPSIIVSGSFTPLIRTDGLLAVGAWKASVAPGTFVQYETMAHAIAAQVVDERNRKTLVPCTPAANTDFDEACARQFLSKAGRLLFRRPLTQEEVVDLLKISRTTATSLGSFYQGIAFGLANLLVSPDFLFVIDVAEADPKRSDALRLNAYSKASRLSFLLWDTAPDDRLLIAAEKGELNSRDGLERQVERMLRSPRLKSGVRAFFSDLLGFDAFSTLVKDIVLFPAFGPLAAQDAKEESLRAITDLLVTRDGDYRDLFTTRRTFMSQAVGRLYKVPVTAGEGAWEPYEFPRDDSRVGILGQLSFLALYSNPGRSSPTLRGKAVRTIFLCQKVPDPPANVDFSQFIDPNSPNKTARQRMAAHATAPTCAGCHKVTDPVGLALENFDGAGQFRTAENGEPVNTEGDLDGTTYKDAAGLAKALHDHPAVPACLVNRMAAYAIGRTPTANDPWVAYLSEDFAAHGYSVKRLLRRIALSDALYAVSKRDGAVPSKSAMNQSNVQ